MLCRMKSLINRRKLYSIPSWLGKTKALRVSELLHVISAACVVVAGIYGKFWYMVLGGGFCVHGYAFLPAFHW